DPELIQEQQDRFPLHELEGDVDVTGKPFYRVAVLPGIGDPFEDEREEPVASRPQTGGLFGDVGGRDLDRLPEPDDSRQVLRTGPPAALLSTSLDQGIAPDAAADVERSDALGAVKLVCRERE